MTAVNAQTILKGDMNDDKDVNIADVTSLVDVVLGKAPKEEINVGGDPYKVDKIVHSYSKRELPFHG